MQTNNQNNSDSLSAFSISDDDRFSYTNRPKSIENSSTGQKQKSKHSSRSSMLIIVLIIIALTAAGIWQMNTIQLRLDATQAQITQMVAQLDSITTKITRDDHSALKNSEALNQQINALLHNQKKFEHTLTEQKKLLGGLQTETNNNKKEFAGLKWSNKTNSTKTEKQQTDLNQRITKLSEKLEVLSSSQLNSITRWQSQLEKLQRETEAFFASNNNNNKFDDLSKKLTEYGAELKSVNEYRLQINQRLLQIENSVRKLQAQEDKP